MKVSIRLERVSAGLASLEAGALAEFGDLSSGEPGLLREAGGAVAQGSDVPTAGV